MTRLAAGQSAARRCPQKLAGQSAAAAGIIIGLVAACGFGPARGAHAPRASHGEPRHGAQTGSMLRSGAARGDPMDLRQLANELGAVRLVEVARGGGRDGQTALAALIYAPDAELALRWLCGRVAAGDPAALRAVHAVLARPLEPVEPLDPGAATYCKRALGEPASWNDPASYDLAQSALQLIAEQPGNPPKAVPAN